MLWRSDNISYERDDELEGYTREVKMGCEKNLFVTCNFDDNGDLVEVFNILGKSGGCVRTLMDALGIVTSIALQEGADIQKIIDKLENMKCPNPEKVRNEDEIYSCPDAIANTMKMCLDKKSKENF